MLKKLSAALLALGLTSGLALAPASACNGAKNSKSSSKHGKASKTAKAKGKKIGPDALALKDKKTK